MTKHDKRKLIHYSNHPRKLLTIKPKLQIQTNNNFPRSINEVGDSNFVVEPHDTHILSARPSKSDISYNNQNNSVLTGNILPDNLATTDINQYQKFTDSPTLTNKPISILLANGKLIQISNIQSLLASAQIILRQQSNSSDYSNSQTVYNQSNGICTDAGQPSTFYDIVSDNISKSNKSSTLLSMQNQCIVDPNNSDARQMKSDNLANTEYYIDHNEELNRLNRQRLHRLYDDPTRNLQYDDSPTIASTLAAISKTNSSADGFGTTIDGINLDEIKDFARLFKLRRLALGLTQTQVGQSLTATKGPAYSQSAICRFEKLDITPKSAAKIKPVLEKWMKDAERKYAHRPSFLSKLKHGSQTYVDFINELNSRKRKRRTSFSPKALDVLNRSFACNTHPSGAEMTMLAQKLHYDREVIRVWFCNKRQALKNMSKKDSSRSTSPATSLDSNQMNMCSDNSSSGDQSCSPCSVTHIQSNIKEENMPLSSNCYTLATQTSVPSICSIDFNQSSHCFNQDCGGCLPDHQNSYNDNHHSCETDIKDIFGSLSQDNCEAIPQLTFADAVKEVTDESVSNSLLHESEHLICNDFSKSPINCLASNQYSSKYLIPQAKSDQLYYLDDSHASANLNELFSSCSSSPNPFEIKFDNE
ncbi:hypothetical protein GJ496_006424 [Pomphorhynchus laevis]|nr:hypothetical protein GJ496_006424 [Pomphorhynchus laevis]